MIDLTLTPRQQQIMDFIRSYVRDNGYPPTIRDIGAAIGLSSSSTVHRHLSNLEQLGLVRRDPSKPRAIELVVNQMLDGVTQLTRSGKSGLPLVGQVAAGAPIAAEENVEEYLEVPPEAGGDIGEFVLKVRGDSMINAGIQDRDCVVVAPQATAVDGEIVVAMLDSEATVKRFFHEGDYIRLQPENDELEPIITTDVQILGKVVGVMRRIY